MKASENTFQLPPFPAFPCISRYVPLGSVAEAIDRICRSIKSSDGISLLVGPPGTGKSLICRIIADQFGSTHDVVLLGDTDIENKPAFYRHLLHHLGVDLGTIPQGDLHLALIDAVCGNKSAEGGLLIIIDEAQSLSAEVLEAIRMATNIISDDQPRVTAVVCGGAKLDDTLTNPSLEPFSQRVSTRCYLHPMNASETRQYIRDAIRACGSNPDEIISDEALGAVHHACSGVPRLINQIMTEAIDCAADNDQDHICEKVIDQAWARLQQLPSPMVEEPKIKLDASPVEFGTLSDSTESPNKTAPIETATVPPQIASFEPSVVEIPPSLIAEEACDQSACQQSACSEGAAPGDFASTGDNSTDEESSLVDNATPQATAEVSPDPTIQWADEPEDQETLVVAPGSFRDVPAPKPLPAELFGEFEIEESIPVGNGVITTPTTNETPLDLESMIHSEIVNLSEVAAEARFGCGDTDLTEIQSVDMNHQPVVWVDASADEAAAEPVECDDIVLSTDAKSDDSDLLVIEDEVDVAPQPNLTRVDNQEQTVNVDYRAMLSNMRQNS